MASRHGEETACASGWRRHIAAWQRSGESIRVYCLRHELSEASFHAWKSKFKRRDEQEAKGLGRAHEVRGALFAEVCVDALREDEGRCSFIEVRLGSGRSVRVWPGFDEETLARVLRVVENLPC